MLSQLNTRDFISLEESCLAWLSCFTIQSIFNNCIPYQFWKMPSMFIVMLHVFALQFNLASTLIARFEKENSH